MHSWVPMHLFLGVRDEAFLHDLGSRRLGHNSDIATHSPEAHSIEGGRQGGSVKAETLFSYIMLHSSRETTQAPSSHFTVFVPGHIAVGWNGDEQGHGSVFVISKLEQIR